MFINRILRALNPAWVRWEGNNVVRLVPCGGRTSLVERMPAELRACGERGGDTTLIVWADLDHDMADGEALKRVFWQACQAQGIERELFDRAVFVFAKDRLENWIEYLNTGATDEGREGPRVSPREAADAARTLAERCRRGAPEPQMPPSLKWSCQNWRELTLRMRG
ncbi:MAG: hypothetical protein ACK47B_17255 [Armatimonadota bacterium]